MGTITYLGWKTSQQKYTNALGQTCVTDSIQQERWSQSLPINQPLPYRAIYQKSDWISNPENKGVISVMDPSGAGISGGSEISSSTAYNKAYKRLVEQMLGGDRPELGINIASLSLTRQLITDDFRAKGNILQKIADASMRHDAFCRHLRLAMSEKRPKRRYKRIKGLAQKIGFGGTASEFMRLRAPGKNHKLVADVANSFAEEYLKYHFAWAPLIGDLFNLLTALKQDYEFHDAVLRSTAYETLTGPKGGVKSYPYPFTRTITVEPYRAKCKIQARASVLNKPLFVLNRVGLINPFTVAWDRAAFTYVYDWFANFSQMFAAPTDFVGVSISNPEYTFYGEAIGKVANVTNYPHVSPSNNWAWKWVYVRRFTPGTLPLPSLVFENPITGWRRGLAQIALLTQFGTKAGTPKPRY